MHAAAEPWPTSELKVPGRHETGLVVATGQYWPTGQGRHAAMELPPVRALYVPALQFWNMVDPTGQKLAVGQLLHVDWFTTGL